MTLDQVLQEITSGLKGDPKHLEIWCLDGEYVFLNGVAVQGIFK